MELFEFLSTIHFEPEQTESLAKLVKKAGSAVMKALGLKTSCTKCGSDWMVHSYYGANTNYGQCNCCGKSFALGESYLYCPKCSSWGFCGKCVDSKQAPMGCDTKSCAKCKKKSLKSYKYYGANFNYAKCNSCKRDIGMNCFYWYCDSCSSWGYCYKCTMEGKCGS